MSDVDLGFAIRLTPEEAVKYFEAKELVITGSWHELYEEAHAKAFTVAHLARLDLEEDIQNAITKSLKEGKTEKWFIKEMTTVCQKKGWWGKAIDPDTGEILEVYPGTSVPVQWGSPRRLSTIYRVNMMTAYSVGGYKFDSENQKSRPYWQYWAVKDGRTRPTHAALHGRVWEATDPVWDSIYPPNGFNCRCGVRTLSKKRLDKEGLKVESSAGKLEQVQVRVGQDDDGNPITKPVTRLRYMDKSTGKEMWFQPDPGWSYNPGKAGMEALAQAKKKVPPPPPPKLVPTPAPVAPTPAKPPWAPLPGSEVDMTPARPASSPRDGRPPPPRFSPAQRALGLQKFGGEVDTWGLRAMNAQQQKLGLPELTVEESAAIRMYTGGAYKPLNIALRAGEYETDPYLQAYVDAAQEGLQKMPRFVGPSIRGATFKPDALDQVLKRYQEGAEVEENSFVSSSYGDEAAFDGNVIMKIDGKTGVNIARFSQYGAEREVLFAPGTRFRVDKVDKERGKYIITMTEL